ncbi:hypothetical protein HEQ69_07255 [Haematospirillum jordaniae]|uniref:hypothetical protein n=1 Tax=Haematospirillum jordaniae TaxID=1549855 RepID=UPI0014329FDF|nr:hypothetical protein [Haematospirillum jordaniae]NKD45511.1 hypothetical protein [Haematospirillum jordaniae]NKD91764.1 hypothetical protein [Haematospirillum jordaniae]
MAGFQTIEPFIRSRGGSSFGDAPRRRARDSEAPRTVPVVSRHEPDFVVPDPEETARREMIALRQQRKLDRELATRRARAALSPGGMESASFQALTDSLSEDANRAIERIDGRAAIQSRIVQESAKRQREERAFISQHILFPPQGGKDLA